VERGAARLQRVRRLRESKDFQRIGRDGQRRVSSHFVVIVGEQGPRAGESGPLLGVTVSGKVGTAVERNRVKRRIREWFRRAYPSLPVSAAVVVIARRGAPALSAGETERELRSLLQ
jgi:ribonuclease P protein component